MKRRATLRLVLSGTMLVAAMVLFTTGCAWRGDTGPRLAPTQIEPVAYHGWSNALRMTSPAAEVIVVPEVGRVMSFRLHDGQNVFWEDRTLDGKRGDATGKEWINFGGDKTWPAPEAEWGRYTGRKQWMPPAAFDSMSVEATIMNREVVLTSPVDPNYGIRTVRTIRLLANELFITTTYECVSGEPSKIGIWVITQFKDPLVIYAPVEPKSIFADGYFKFTDAPWLQLQRKAHLGVEHLEVTRDPTAPHKMGCDADRLIWVGENETCVVSSARVTGAEYPDRGASAEIYTNPDPKKYIEIEMLGPLSMMKSGDKISRTNIYTLQKRTSKNPEEELLLLRR